MTSSAIWTCQLSIMKSGVRKNPHMSDQHVQRCVARSSTAPHAVGTPACHLQAPPSCAAPNHHPHSCCGKQLAAVCMHPSYNLACPLISALGDERPHHWPVLALLSFPCESLQHFCCLPHWLNRRPRLLHNCAALAVVACSGSFFTAPPPPRSRPPPPRWRPGTAGTRSPGRSCWTPPP